MRIKWAGELSIQPVDLRVVHWHDRPHRLRLRLDSLHVSSPTTSANATAIRESVAQACFERVRVNACNYSQSGVP